MAAEEKKGFINDRKLFTWFALLDKAQKQPEEVTLKEQKVLKNYGFEVYFDEGVNKYKFKIIQD